jgi:hypothetical protein
LKTGKQQVENPFEFRVLALAFEKAKNPRDFKQERFGLQQY